MKRNPGQNKKMFSTKPKKQIMMEVPIKIQEPYKVPNKWNKKRNCP